MKHHPRQTGPWIRQDRSPTLDELAWLQSAQGREVCQAMAGEQPADTPSAIARWRQKLQHNLVAAAWNQVIFRAKAKAKFSQADRMLFDRVGLEQATDELIAKHKAKRFDNLSNVADLCCGIGGDASALAENRQLTAVDFSPIRAAIAEHNARTYGQTIKTIVGDVNFDLPEAEAIHIDPDRRQEKKRSHQPEESSPGLDVIRRIVEHYHHAAVKLSPGTTFNILGFDAEIEVISHNRECKQAVAWTGRFKQAYRRATVLPSGESISATKNEKIDWPQPHPVTPEKLLFEPDPAVIRANLVGKLAHLFDLSPIDERIAYLTGDQNVDTSMLKAFRVIDSCDFSAKRIRQWLNKHDIGRVDLKTRGFAAQPEEIDKHLKKLSGKKQAVLFLTRVNKKPLAILTERL
ncbi:MAG: THUMP-like domain-containing protein [Planctomycetota bacterium]|jgi:SAM-dependent methyltransferase